MNDFIFSFILMRLKPVHDPQASLPGAAILLEMNLKDFVKYCPNLRKINLHSKILFPFVFLPPEYLHVASYHLNPLIHRQEKIQGKLSQAVDSDVKKNLICLNIFISLLLNNL